MVKFDQLLVKFDHLLVKVDHSLVNLFDHIWFGALLTLVIGQFDQSVRFSVRPSYCEFGLWVWRWRWRFQAENCHSKKKSLIEYQHLQNAFEINKWSYQLVTVFPAQTCKSKLFMINTVDRSYHTFFRLFPLSYGKVWPFADFKIHRDSDRNSMKRQSP